MTYLTDAMDKGFKIMISEMVEPDKVVAAGDPVRVLVFHPLNYSYLSLDDPFEAHVQNIFYNKQKLEEAAEAACKRIDQMVDRMNKKYEPSVAVFLPNTTVQENEDGSFTFSAQPIGFEPEPVASDEFERWSHGLG